MSSYSSWVLYVNCFALDFGALPRMMEQGYFIWTYILFLQEAHNSCQKLKCFCLSKDSTAVKLYPSALSIEDKRVRLVQKEFPAFNFYYKLPSEY